MVSVIRTIVFFLPVFIFSTCYSENSKTLEIDLVNTEDFKFLLTNAVPEKFFLSTITVESDIPFSDQEFFYLTSLYPNSALTFEILAQSFIYLKCKNKFSAVTLSIMYYPNDTVSFHVHLTGMWTIHKVVFKGLLSDSQRYRTYYLLESGEPFSLEKHKHSLRRIVEGLHNLGYLNAQVLDYFDYDQINKMITVNIVIDKNAQCIIKDLCFNISSHKNFVDISQLQGKLIKKFFSHFSHHVYTQELINKETKNIKNFLINCGFIDSRIFLKTKYDQSNNGISLFFSIELINKKRFVFSGNKFFTKKQLHTILLQFGSSLALLPESILQEEIRAAYQKKGFWHANIELVKQGTDLLFMVEEGRRIQLADVIFDGVNNAHIDLLAQACSGIGKESYFDEDGLKIVLDACTTELLKQGFINAKILKQDYVPVDDSALYTLHITIEEGQQFYLKEVIIPEFPELVAIIELGIDPESKIFDPFCLKIQKEWLESYFQQHGAFLVRLVPDLLYEKNQISVIWKVQEGNKKLRFGKVIVQGNSRYPFSHIMRELDFEEGMDWSKEKIENSIARLRKLGIFETIYVHPLHILPYEENKPILIKLKEDDPFEIRARFGFQQVSAPNLTLRKGTTYKIGGSLLYKNPFNDGGFFRFDSDFTRFYRNVCLIYKKPWIFSLPVSTLYTVYSNKYIQPVYIGSDKPLYQALQQGFLIGVFRCWPIIDLGFNIGFETMETNDLSIQLAEAINFKPYFIDKKVPYFFLEHNTVLNYLDDQLNPTRGLLIVLSIKSMLTWEKSISSFTKILYEQSMFFPLLSWVMALRFRVGHIFNQEFNTIMPPERFYLGGAHSIRSYEPDFSPPLGCYIDDHGKEQLVPQGGRTMINGNFEIRFPIWRKLGGVVFQDMGMLIEKSFTEVIKGNRFVAGTGFGLRYNTPLGPLSFDIGFKWWCFNKLEKRYAWFLSLGQAF